VLFAYSGIQTDLHVLREEFQHESTLLVLTHDGAAGLEFIHEGVG
jgi:hypothetical protein